MSEPSPSTADAFARVPPTSPRVRLARLALDAALALPEIAEGNSGPMGSVVTGDRGEVMRGVSAAAGEGGRYDLTVRLTVNPTPAPLHPLANRLRDAIAVAAGREGLDPPLGRIDVHFADVARAAEEAGRAPDSASPPAPPPAPPSPPPPPPPGKAAGIPAGGPPPAPPTPPPAPPTPAPPGGLAAPLPPARPPSGGR